jgi:tetratricopeptide (TPR) repeat protein
MSQNNKFNPDFYFLLEKLISDQNEIFLDEVKFNSFIEENNLSNEIIDLIKLSFDFDLPNLIYNIIKKDYYEVNELESVNQNISSSLNIQTEKAELLFELMLFLLDKNSLINYFLKTAYKKYYSENYNDNLKAQELLERSLILIPDNSIETYDLLGDTFHYKLKDYSNALINFQIAHSKNAEFNLINLKLGQIYHFDLRKYDLAISHYNKEIELSPNESLTYTELIKLYKRTENKVKIEETIRRFVFAIPGYLSFTHLYWYFNNYKEVISFSNYEIQDIILKGCNSYYDLLQFSDYLMLIQRNYILSSDICKQVIDSINNKYSPDYKSNPEYYNKYSAHYEKAIINYTFLNVIILKNIKHLVKFYLFDCWLKTIFSFNVENSEESIDKEVYDIMPIVKNHLINLFYCFPDEFTKALDCYYPLKNRFEFLFHYMKKFKGSIEDLKTEEMINMPTTYNSNQYSSDFHNNSNCKFEKYYAEFFYNKAKKEEESKKYKEAINYINLAIIANPNNELYYFMRGIYYYNLSNFENAIINFKKNIELNPTSEYGYIWKGYSNYDLKKYEDAIVDFSNAIKINPFIEAGYVYRSKARFEVKDYYGCINDCDFLIKKNIDLSTYLILRGKSYLCIRNKKKGFNDLSKASELGDKEAFELIKNYSNDK